MRIGPTTISHQSWILHCNMTQSADLDQLKGRYRRLEAELTSASEQQPLPIRRIDRLVAEMLETERVIRAQEPALADGVANTHSEELPRGLPLADPASTRRLMSKPRNRLTPFGTRAPPSADE